MGRILTNISFEEWVRHIFDHPVATSGEQEWWWDDDAPEWDDSAEIAVELITRLFENSVESLKHYSDEQIGQGMWGMVSSSCLGVLDHLFMQKAAWPLRRRGIESIIQLFQDLMAPRCRKLHFETQSHLEMVCYMWWDIACPWGDPDDPSRREEDQVCLDVMKQILHLDSENCVESALHGLGHWEMLYPEFVHETIATILQSKSTLSPPLREYALAAMDGCVQ